MKVMCIEENWRWIETRTLVQIPAPKYGETCTVVEENDFGYKLDEYPEGTVKGWHKGGFIPLSEIDEEELVRERELETV